MSKGSSAFRFRVSDVVDVPLRGHLLRLRLLEGEPDLDQLRPGRSLRLRSPRGDERVVTVTDFSVTGGKPTRERLLKYRELDILVSEQDALADGNPVEIGWLADGPAPAS